jgi:hypothetical protein
MHIACWASLREVQPTLMATKDDAMKTLLNASSIFRVNKFWRIYMANEIITASEAVIIN